MGCFVVCDSGPGLEPGSAHCGQPDLQRRLASLDHQAATQRLGADHQGGDQHGRGDLHVQPADLPRPEHHGQCAGPG